MTALIDEKCKQILVRSSKDRVSSFALGTASVILVSVSACIPFSSLPNRIARFSTGALALALGAVGTIKTQKLLAEEPFRAIAEKAAVDIAANSWAAYVESKLEGIAGLLEEPSQVQQLACEIELFDWQLFNTDPNKWPHLAIVGGTGDGKSHTTEWAIGWLDGIALVCHPHKKPSDYPGVAAVYGGGRNYGDWKNDNPVDFNALVTGRAGSVSFASFMKTLEVEMDRRYKLYELGNENYPLVNVVLDEFNTALAKVPKAIEPWKNLIREARKVKIRLVCLLQNDSVKSLKIEGDGALRECLKYVRLGGFAKKHAKRLKLPELEAWAKRQKYPILVEDAPATLEAYPAKKQQQYSASIPQYPEPLDLTKLVRVSLNETRLLPARPGVYFVVDLSFRPHYIGSSNNIMLRWNSKFGEHGRMSYFRELEALGIPVAICAYPCANYEDEEDRLVIEFKPYLNGQSLDVTPHDMRRYWSHHATTLPASASVEVLHAPTPRDSTRFACPACNSTNYAVHGVNRSGTKRYRCKDCGKTFSVIS